MKILFALTLALLPVAVSAASADYYLKLDTIKGEATMTTVATTTPARAGAATTITAPPDEPQGKGNVEFEWKVEEGQKMTVDPDFGILLGGGSAAGADDEERMHGLARAEVVLLENAKASDQAIEQISLNFEKISTKVRHEGKLFGFIPAFATATVDIDAEERVSVTFPWWAVFASGKDGDALGVRIYTTISNVLKTKHDTVKNSINNVR